MPKTVLIAALGDHPAVITSAVTAFDAAGTTIHELRLLYPDEGDKATPLQRIIGGDGVQLIREYLQEHYPACTLEPEPLPFADATSVADSIEFLRCLRIVLDGYEKQVGTEVLVLVAGGRKNMAALMALAAQFYPNVRGMYHLLHRREDKQGGVFQSLGRVLASRPNALNDVRDSLKQDPADLNLFPIPYTASGGDGKLLRDAVDAMNRGEPYDAVSNLPVDAALFYKAALAREPAPPAGQAKAPAGSSSALGLDVWLSATAEQQYRAWEQAQSPLAAECLKHLPAMADVAHLARNSVHDIHWPFCVYRMTGSTVRPLFVTKPAACADYPHGQYATVVVAAFARDSGRGEYTPPLASFNGKLDTKPAVRLTQLYPEQRALIVPLGKSPMVATQTYALMSESEVEGKPRIPLVVLVFPERDSSIREDVELLERLFDARGVSVRPYPVPGYKDLNSTVACEAYLDTLCTAAADLRAENPDRRIDMSLSGGRKGMSALALAAAQSQRIGKLYHTIITDRDLERKIEQETDWVTLHGTAPDAALAARLFLDAYDRSKFVLFPIPVFPFAMPPIAP
jgi:hypothetical protein